MAPKLRAPAKGTRPLTTFLVNTNSHLSIRERITAQSPSSPQVLSAQKARMLDMMAGTSEVDVIETKVSLICPYSQRTISIPVRSRECRHLQCADLDSWVAMFEHSKSMRDPKTNCPTCHQRVACSSLVIDRWMEFIIKHVNCSSRSVILAPDGSFKPAEPRKQGDDILLEATTQDPIDVCVRIKTEPEEDAIGRQNSLEEEQQEVQVAGTPSPSNSTHFLVIEESPFPVSSKIFSLSQNWRCKCSQCGSFCTLVTDTLDLFSCCGLTQPRGQWCLVREFSEELVGELLLDNTLILSGLCSDKIGPWLLRAGFFRSETGHVWFTQFDHRFGRFELDFLEALCVSSVAGGNPAEVQPIPDLFKLWDTSSTRWTGGSQFPSATGSRRKY